MLGWLKTKGENTRVYMCMKEVRWELERADHTKAATILALAHFFRAAMLEDIVPRSILDKPLDYSRADLMQLYSVVEGLRNNSNMELARSKKVSQRIGFALPPFVEEHTKNCARGLEVWMCTIGAGIQPELRDEARTIWRYLSVSKPALPTAITRMFEIEAVLAEMSGTMGGIFSGITLEEWIAECEFVPSSFVAHL